MKEGARVANAKFEVTGEMVHELKKEIDVEHSHLTEDHEMRAKYSRLEEALNDLLDQVYHDLRLKGVERNIRSVPLKYKLRKKARELYEETQIILKLPASQFVTGPTRKE
jgi:hypothetical protein